MCAEFMIVAKVKELARRLGMPLSKIAETFEWGERIFPRGIAPVIYRVQESAVIAPMQFSLIPSWSKERAIKFATHNARLDSVTEKATWKKPFLKQRAVAPLSAFIEPSYEGEFAGTMVRFTPTETDVLFAAALWESWKDPGNGEEVLSFAIITDEPSPVVRSIGHDRQPVFIKPEAIDAWLDSGIKEGNAVRDLLAHSKSAPALVPVEERKMKPGWEKRVKK